MAAASRRATILHCALGQAHAAGLLEGTRVDGRVLLEHGKEWCRLYRVTFGGSVPDKQARADRPIAAEPRDRSSGSSLSRLGGDRRRLTPREREYLNLVCIEYGDSWALPPFLERLVNRWKARQRPPLYAGAYLPVRGDEAKLAALRSALLAIVEGSRNRIPRGR
jgi:hypothetical protein